MRNRFKAWVLEKAVKILDEEEVWNRSFEQGNFIPKQSILRLADTFRRNE